MSSYQQSHHSADRGPALVLVGCTRRPHLSQAISRAIRRVTRVQAALRDSARVATSRSNRLLRRLAGAGTNPENLARIDRMPDHRAARQTALHYEALRNINR